MVLAYLVKERGMQLDEAIMYVRKSRPSVLPNQGFLQQLEAFTKSCMETPQQSAEESDFMAQFMQQEPLQKMKTPDPSK